MSSLELLCEELELISAGPTKRDWTLALDRLLLDILVACGCDEYVQVDEARQATRRRASMVEDLVPLLRARHVSGLVKAKWIDAWKARAEQYDHCLHCDRNPALLFASDSSEEASRDFDSTSEEEEEDVEDEESASSEEEEGSCSAEEGEEDEPKNLKRAADEPLALDAVELKKAKTTVL